MLKLILSTFAVINRMKMILSLLPKKRMESSKVIPLKRLGYDHQKMILQLKRHEGIRLEPYRCTADKLTIGVGRNLDDRGITEDEAEFLLFNDIGYVHDNLKKELPWFETLNDVRQRVLLDMAFNLGISGLLKFKNTLENIANGKYEKASRNMLASKWAAQVGQRSATLSRMMRTGLDPDYLCNQVD